MALLTRIDTAKKPATHWSVYVYWVAMPVTYVMILLIVMAALGYVNVTSNEVYFLTPLFCAVSLVAHSTQPIKIPDGPDEHQINQLDVLLKTKKTDIKTGCVILALAVISLAWFLLL